VTKVIEKMQSVKMFLGIVLILWSKVDLYLLDKSTEAGSNNFIIFVLGFMFVARAADKVIYKMKEGGKDVSFKSIKE